MEKNRTIWIIFSISLFSVVVLAGGLYFLRPKSEEGAAAASITAPAGQGFDIYEYARGRSELPGLVPAGPEPYYEGKEIIVGEKEEETGKREEEAVRPVSVVKKVESRPAPAQPKKAVRAAPTQKQVKPAPKEVRVTEYWIQTGSYQSRSRAELVAGKLSEQGLPGRITTRDLGGTAYFRVRIGPYLDRGEAEKFLNWIKSLEGFESSYISQLASRRTIP